MRPSELILLDSGPSCLVNIPKEKRVQFFSFTGKEDHFLKIPLKDIFYVASDLKMTKTKPLL